MKDIPIFILNKDRLGVLKDQVASLHKRGYTNITIVDNKSTYQPLLDWYRDSGVDVYFNPTDKTCNGTLYHLAFSFKIEKFSKPITAGYYVFNDSDVVPIEECPIDFIEDMTEVCKEYNCHKVGLGLKIDDIPDVFYNKKAVLDKERPYWNGQIDGHKMPLYRAAVDTTFAVYTPGTQPLWGPPERCLRTGGVYLGRHIPWYYDYNNLPEDEKYYIMNLEANKGPYWSLHAKNVVK